MTQEELLETAVDNLRDTTKTILSIAADPMWLNEDGKTENHGLKELKEEFSNRLTLCFTLKNAFAQIKSDAIKS